MGTQVQVSDITNIDNASGVPTINTNFDLVADEFDQVLYRDGNQSATGDLDMDSNRIINLPAPASSTEPIRVADIEAGITDTDLSIVLASGAGADFVGSNSGGSIQDDLDLIEDRLSFVFTPQMYGAVGDGVTDDTTALNNMFAAADGAIGGTVYITPGTYLVTDNLFVYNGIKRVVGQGGIIKFNQSSGTKSLVLATTGGVHVSDCIVEGLNIDTNGKQTLGIYGQNIRRCTIRNNYIYNLTNTSSGIGIYIKSFYTGAHAAHSNLIEGNRIDGQTTHASHSASQISIVITGDWTAQAVPAVPGDGTTYNGYSDSTAEWKATFDNIVPVYYAEKNIVRNNVVNGGRYGIELIGAKNCVVKDNIFLNNTRAISMQLRVTQCLIANNRIDETLTTGVGLGYSCNDNIIIGNSLTSTLANSDSEACYFAYVGCKRNRFISNSAYIDSGATGPAYMLYAAIHADQNQFIGNTCRGPVQRAYMALESAWDNTVVNTSHRAQGGASSLNNFANAGSGDVEFINNTLYTNSAKPAMFWGQYVAVGCTLAYPVMSGNRIRGSYSRVIEVVQTNAGAINNATLAGNIHPTTATSGFRIEADSTGLTPFAVFNDPKLVYTATWDPANIANGANATTTVAIEGAAVGQFVQASFSLDLQGMVLTAHVSAADTVTAVINNNTGGAIDLASGTLSIKIVK